MQTEECSLIIDSRDCPVEWLSTVLRQPLLGGEVIIRWSEKTRDVWPATTNWMGEPSTPQA